MPQGSVFGPFFLAYLNDLDDPVGSPVKKFDDDTKLLSVFF